MLHKPVAECNAHARGRVGDEGIARLNAWRRHGATLSSSVARFARIARPRPRRSAGCLDAGCAWEGGSRSPRPGRPCATPPCLPLTTVSLVWLGHTQYRGPGCGRRPVALFAPSGFPDESTCADRDRRAGLVHVVWRQRFEIVVHDDHIGQHPGSQHAQPVFIEASISPA